MSPETIGKQQIHTFGEDVSIGDGMDWVSFSIVPLQLSLYAGIFVMASGIFYMAYIAYAKFVTHQVLPGWTSLIMVVLIIGGVQLNILGAIGIYVGKIYEEIKGRPLYIVSDFHGFGSKQNFSSAVPH